MTLFGKTKQFDVDDHRDEWQEVTTGSGRNTHVLYPMGDFCLFEQAVSPTSCVTCHGTIKQGKWFRWKLPYSKEYLFHDVYCRNCWGTEDEIKTILIKTALMIK
jgi:hypothetical protein